MAPVACARLQNGPKRSIRRPNISEPPGYTPQTKMDSLDWQSIGSVLATIMFLRTAFRDFVPPEVSRLLKRVFRRLLGSVQTNVSMIIEEFDSSYNNSDLFESVQSYLSAKCFSSAKVLKLSKPKNSKNLTFLLDSNQKIEETFHGIPVKWTLHTTQKKSDDGECRYFELSFHKQYKERVHYEYLCHVMDEAAAIKFKNMERRLYTNRSADGLGRLWSSVPFNHPSTFDTMAIDPVLKEEIKADLMKFVNRREYYNRVGRAWKRGYFLYGPPGTGKTSLIAAIANFLEFDIYDLELTAVTSNSQLRRLLIATSSRSVIVVEDVDCTLDLSDRNNKFVKKKDSNGGLEAEVKEEKEKEKNSGRTASPAVSLSGVLNFVDGLWSCCGGERLMIFTTNHKERLDAALLRAGRMDKHINLEYCEFGAFKTLAKNYLYLDKHPLMGEIEEILPLAKITPADIGEVFMSCNDDANVGMINVLEELKRRVAAIERKKEIGEMEKEVGLAGDPIGKDEEAMRKALKTEEEE